MSANHVRERATAGLRGASWDLARMPAGVSNTIHALTTAARPRPPPRSSS
jgi:hypothetical protein